MIELVFPKLTAYQQEVYDWLGDPFEKGLTAVLKSVRQSGKTYLLQVELLRMAFAHKCTSIIFEPTIPLARKVYKSITKALDGTGLIKSANAQLLEVEFNNGSEILFKSTEQLNRGLVCTGLLVLDETAYLDDDAIFSILPLKNAHNCSLICASSPFTQDGFYYDIYLQGLGDNPKIKTFDWSKHPEISRFLTEEQKALYKQVMSKAKYTTEIEGSFLSDWGLLFTGLENCLGNPDPDVKILYLGIDFGTGSDEDYTVLSVFNNVGQQVKLYRTNHLSPTQQIDWLCGLILDLANSYTIKTVLCEENSIGKVYIDSMRQKLNPKRITITNWTTTNKSKQDLVTTFQIGLENQYLQLLDNPIQLNEIRKYQAEINAKTKTITYNGFKSNDDTVIANMLAYYAYKKHFGNASISFA